MLVYRVDKSYVIIISPLLCLLKFLIAVITALSFKTARKEFTPETLRHFCYSLEQFENYLHNEDYLENYQHYFEN